MLCYNILNTLSTNGERVLQEMCKVATLPSCIASFIERVCDDGETRNSVRNEANMFVEDSIKKFCSIVIKLCTSGRLQPSSSTPAFLHAEALLSTCLRLIRRFMPVRAEQAVVDLASQPPIEVKMPRYHCQTDRIYAVLIYFCVAALHWSCFGLWAACSGHQQCPSLSMTAAFGSTTYCYTSAPRANATQCMLFSPVSI